MATFRLTTSVTATNPVVHDLYLDDSGQLELIGTDISDTTDYVRAIAQRVKCRLLLVRGEWYQDLRVGTPWRERVWKKGVTESEVNRMLREVIIATPGVRSLESMDIDFDRATRTATVTNLQMTSETGELVTIEALDEPMVLEAPIEAL